ncbi:Gmad2 immunoglobulin-like domain-containing protein [Micromonospora krabiensis]|uniref:Sporulation and spore germination n=1 Tax=Micromonospora krabiensis TaxID=307121 RepID=A0A1C3N1D1_9ACTN|nr:Gmad2 immunoglobulin-like domain-containing protein [Micromonospora krabiensis]SBV26402.1 Sporulation and spore germination [Micromonospora krabiensis]
MRRPQVAVLLAAALATAGCAPPRSGSLGPAPTAAPPSAAPTPSIPVTGGTTVGPGPATSSPGPAPATSSPTSAPTATVTLELWFVRDGRLAPTRRTRPGTPATSRLALTELAVGPTAAESSAGLTTLVPGGTEPVGVAGGVATVRLGAAAAATRRLREAQVVWTLTQFPTVRQVRFDPPGADGPVDRGDYADLLPPVVVTNPVIGQRITSPLTVTGTADVFEATVSVRLLDAGGREIATTFTTASCGSGCRGDYRTALGWRVAAEQRGVLEVYEVSAHDGSRINVVQVPVTLVPGRG